MLVEVFLKFTTSTNAVLELPHATLVESLNLLYVVILYGMYKFVIVVSDLFC